MANKRDYYEVLGIDKNATQQEIKRAYRKMAKQYHPDINKAADAEEKFKEVQEAYDVLSDENKKAAYDRYGHAAFDQAGGAGGTGFGGFGDFGFGQDVDLGDIFGSFFGGGRSRQRRNGPQKGQDRLMRIQIDFMEAINGTTKEISIDYDETCSHCGGSGAASSSDIETCSRCNGRGTVQTQQRTPFGVFMNETVCPDCQGKGKRIKKACNNCKGKGYIHKSAKIDINIPAGINSHQQVRVQGKGERGINGGPNGDLYVEIIVRDHKHFTRDGNDIYIQIPISVADAALGCKVDVPTVYGEVEMSIPAGIQSGKTLRLKEKGVKSLRGNFYGDQYVRVEVEIPKKLSKKQKELYEKLRKEEGKESIFESFKKAFK